MTDSPRSEPSSRLSTSTSKPPIILLVLADDIGTDNVPGYWAASCRVDMPNLEELISKGVLFTDAHSAPM